jgi:hypothetical protein
MPKVSEPEHSQGIGPHAIAESACVRLWVPPGHVKRSFRRPDRLAVGAVRCLTIRDMQAKCSTRLNSAAFSHNPEVAGSPAQALPPLPVRGPSAEQPGPFLSEFVNGL